MLVGITVMPEYFQSESVNGVLDRLERLAGVTAVTTSPYVMAPADRRTGFREPPLDAGAGKVRLLDRTLWGKREVWARTAPSFHPNLDLYRGLRYQPPSGGRPDPGAGSPGRRVHPQGSVPWIEGLPSGSGSHSAGLPGPVRPGGTRRLSPPSRRQYSQTPPFGQRQPGQPPYPRLHPGAPPGPLPPVPDGGRPAPGLARIYALSGGFHFSGLRQARPRASPGDGLRFQPDAKRRCRSLPPPSRRTHGWGT